MVRTQESSMNEKKKKIKKQNIFIIKLLQCKKGLKMTKVWDRQRLKNWRQTRVSIRPKLLLSLPLLSSSKKVAWGLIFHIEMRVVSRIFESYTSIESRAARPKNHLSKKIVSKKFRSSSSFENFGLSLLQAWLKLKISWLHPTLSCRHSKLISKAHCSHILRFELLLFYTKVQSLANLFKECSFSSVYFW